MKTHALMYQVHYYKVHVWTTCKCCHFLKIVHRMSKVRVDPGPTSQELKAFLSGVKSIKTSDFIGLFAPYSTYSLRSPRR